MPKVGLKKDEKTFFRCRKGQREGKARTKSERPFIRPHFHATCCRGAFFTAACSVKVRFQASQEYPAPCLNLLTVDVPA